MAAAFEPGRDAPGLERRQQGGQGQRVTGYFRRPASLSRATLKRDDTIETS